MKPPKVSVIMPVYNTRAYVVQAVQSVLAQSFSDFELLIVDDAGTDGSIDLCRDFNDHRIRIISQENRGLAGARNTGIRAAQGTYIALLDSDDYWSADKLRRHVAHFESNPALGVSYAASQMVDDFGHPMRIVQRPQLKGVTARTVFLRNPIGNGSAPVIRKAVFDAIAHHGPRPGEIDYFDDSFRQSEDIECWMRIALTTEWRFEGIPGVHTFYRINGGGLSANVIRQFESWMRVRDKVRDIAPDFANRHASAAEAYQLRYLARRAVHMLDRGLAIQLAWRALKLHPLILFSEPAKTLTTLCAAVALRCLPDQSVPYIRTAMMRG